MRRYLVAAVLLIAFFRLWLSLNLPLHLWDGAHDDGLFLRLAESLLAGQWLGSYDQMILAKGPGYPVFIALASFLGIPLTLAHGVIQLAGIAFASFAVWRISKSETLGFLTFAAMALYPVGLLPSVNRVLRDQIYWPLTLIAFGGLAVILLAPMRRQAANVAIALIAGVAFGWAWLTREEGITLLPMVAILVAGAVIISGWRSVPWRILTLPAAVFLAINIGFMTANWVAYGKFIGVDFKERNFVAALDAIQSVGKPTPYVAVSTADLEAISRISPTFAVVNARIDKGWMAFGCQAVPVSCDEFVAGWFMWALRDAAAAAGFYKSPDLASKKFRKIAKDIRTACADGRLLCESSLISYMPPISGEQWSTLPRAALNVITPTLFIHFDTGKSPLMPTDELKTLRWWAMLNYPKLDSALPVPLATKVAEWWLHAATEIYRVVVPALVLAGLASLLAHRRVDALFIAATAAWALVASRITVLALIEATSFAGRSSMYALTAAYMAVLASMLSLYPLAASVTRGRQRTPIAAER